MLRLDRTWGGLLAAMFVLLFGFVDAQAQTYGTDYLSFEGALYVLDNPTSGACQSHGINFGDAYRMVYLFTNNPSNANISADAITLFPQGAAAARMHSTQFPFSLAGTSTIVWIFFDSYGKFNSYAPIPSISSTLTIVSGLGAPVSLATGNIKILGSIPSFLGWPDCNIGSVHGAAVAKPN
jgi:hypothetical protein